ncbi:MAG TPA: methyl-accepting chemotaxis protein [Myxococcales bacterium]|jgi:methyl-accepting chemotaxis protein
MRPAAPTLQTCCRFLPVALALVFAPACGDAEGVQVLAEGWQHRWDEPPADPAARLKWLEGEEGWAPSEAPPRQPEGHELHSGSRVVWQRVKLPRDLVGSQALFVNFVDQNFEVFLGDKSIHRFAAPDGEPLLVGRPWHLIPLGPEASGRHVAFRIKSEHRVIGLAGSVRVGAAVDLMRDRTREGLVAFVLGIIFCVLGVIAAPFALLPGQGALVRRLGALALATGVYVVFNAYSPIKQLIAYAPVLSWYLELTALYLLPAIYLGYYIEAFPHVRFARAIDGFTKIFYVWTAISVGGSLLGFFPIIKTLFPFELVLSLALLVGMLSATINVFDKAPGSWALLVGFAAVGVTGLRDSQVDMRGVLTGETFISPWGFLALLGSLGYVLLGRYFNTVEQLGRYSRELEARNAEMTTTRARTAAAVASLEHDVAALREASSRQVELSNKQADSLRATSSAAQQIAQTSGEAASQASRVVEDAKRSEALSQDGQVQVKATVSAMEKVSVQVEGIAQRLEELGVQTARIDELAATLNDIAERSNVLSLNASLEAVRSGERGAGFAVVAREMGALADQSREDVRKVRALLTEIARSAQAATEASGEGTKTAQGAVGQAHGAGSAIAGLAQVISESSAAAVQIATRAREQTEGVAGIVGSLQDASSAMSEVLEGTRSIDAVAESLTRISRDLAALSGERAS